MNILIYGSNGWIGTQIILYLDNKNISYFKGISRVDDIESLENEISRIKPTHVLSLIGRTHGKIGDKVYSTIDYLEEEGKLVDNIRDNLFSPISLAMLCNQHKIHFTYLGTGCIFEFDENHPFGKEINGFTEESKPNFFGSSYSIVKGFTDRLMHLLPNTLNLRIRMPINAEENPRNFITKITSYEKICSIPNSMSVLPTLIPIAIDLMKKQHTGTLNLTNPGLISHNEILNLYKDIVDSDFKWTNFTVEEQNKILSSKRSNNYLDTTLLEKLYPNIPKITDAVIQCLKLYPKKINKQCNHEKTVEHIFNSNPYVFENSSSTNLLVTGGYGFIGSHFINHMYDTYDNINIINIDAMYYCASENNIRSDIRKSKRFTFVKGNICSSDLIQHVLSSFNINYVIHFAAQSHVQNSFSDAIQYTQDNILGTHTLLETCRKYNKIKRFIHVSTDEVYGESLLDKNEKHKTELSVLCPTNPYAATKAAAELIAKSYYHSFKMPIIITRGNNVYGPNQYPEKLVPHFIELLLQGKQVTIQGDGSNVRAFLHVEDVCSALKLVLEKGEIGEIYNVGSDDHHEYTVKQIAHILIEKLQGTENYDAWIRYIEDRPFNDKRYYISNQKVKNLGWTIETDFNKGLDELIEKMRLTAK